MEGERVLLRVLPMKSMVRFWKKGKLSPRDIGLFEVLERMCEVNYKLALPPRLSGVHLVFHVSMLQKYHEDQSHVLNFSSVLLDENLAYKKEPMAILDRQVQKLRSKDIASVKVTVFDLWKMNNDDEAEDINHACSDLKERRKKSDELKFHPLGLGFQIGDFEFNDGNGK
ncbi:uncharacterized protein [Nicotiana tomentosiformis]|uniref:uncharacterized protein n=1 Tax=Nicotiana tomentosiformis TaxID=4098 RepID=UPI00388C6789